MEEQIQKTNIKTIIFDFGGVLIDWDPRYLYKKIFTDTAEMEWFLQHICSGQWNAEQDNGRPFKEAISLLKNQFPRYINEIEAFYSRWPEMLAGEISSSVEVLKALQSKGYPVFGLTNWSHETFPIALNQFGFLKKLNGIVVSGEEKMSKPHKKIFSLLLSRYSLSAESCIFIDDNEMNINTAKEMGFKTIHFSDPQKMADELRKFDLL